MCRMIFAAGNITPEISSKLVSSLINMSRDVTQKHEANNHTLGKFMHKDGWGAAYLDLMNNKWVIKKSIIPVYEDKSIEEVKNIETEIMILHARLTGGTPVIIENTHPFIMNHQGSDIIFCHNGTICDEIQYSGEFSLQGQTDSEKLLCSILSEPNLSQTNLSGMQSTGREYALAIQSNIKKYFNYTGINIMMTVNGITHIASRKNNYPIYYQMNYCKTPDLLVFSSEKIPILCNNWHKLEFDKIATIDNKTLKFRVEIL